MGMGTQSLFRAITCLYSMKGAGRMTLPHDKVDKVKRANNLPSTRTEHIVFADSVTWDGTKILTAMVTDTRSS